MISYLFSPKTVHSLLFPQLMCLKEKKNLFIDTCFYSLFLVGLNLSVKHNFKIYGNLVLFTFCSSGLTYDEKIWKISWAHLTDDKSLCSKKALSILETLLGLRHWSFCDVQWNERQDQFDIVWVDITWVILYFMVSLLFFCKKLLLWR